MNSYSIEAYNPEWVRKFQGIKELLEGVFGTKTPFLDELEKKAQE